MDDYLWWRDGIIYQIYPRSFADSNGDGLGDLPGITARLDYLADLGIDAIWISPFYPTPDADFGYDVSDHTAVDPRFGTLEDFDRLVAESHRRGIRLVLDLVLNHTSDRHPWFHESRASRDNPKRDWYIWQPPSCSHPIFGEKRGRWRGVPNNWQAAFGGPAWEYDETTGQYYLHMFLAEQPDVNWRNLEVRNAQLDVVRFWLERGADGFRLDVFNAYFKDAHFRNNPTKFGLRGFDRQRHLYDCDQPEMIPLLNELRTILDAYPERYAVGETFFATPEKVLHYSGPDRLHAAFSFDFNPTDLFYPWHPAWLIKQIERREALFTGEHWPTTVLSNHDIPRTATRCARGEEDALAKIAMALLLTLRGTPFMYYGEEIGMRDVSLRRGEIMDPPGKRYWPIFKGRDGCRSPMQWDDMPFAGFSSAKPWLPVHPNYHQRNVAAQNEDPDSLLNFTRKLIALHKKVPALRRGEFVLLMTKPRDALVYLRRTTSQSVLVALKFHDRRVYEPLDQDVSGKRWRSLLAARDDGAVLLSDNCLELAPHQVRLLVAP
jgi:alpha-glucosidase